MLKYFQWAALIAVFTTQCACAPTADEARRFIEMLNYKDRGNAAAAGSDPFSQSYPSSSHSSSSSSSSSSSLNSPLSPSSLDKDSWLQVGGGNQDAEGGNAWSEFEANANRFGETDQASSDAEDGALVASSGLEGDKEEALELLRQRPFPWDSNLLGAWEKSGRLLAPEDGYERTRRARWGRWRKRGKGRSDKRKAPHRGYHASRGKRYLPGLESLLLASYFKDAQKWKRQPHLGFHGSRG